MIIQNNLLAMNAHRQSNISDVKRKKSTEKLSSGYKINRASDDAASLTISEKMRRQIRGLHQSAENIQEGVGYVQTAEGALNEVDDMLQRMNELTIKAANDTNSYEDRESIDHEIQQLKEEISRVFDTTSFNERLIWEPDPDRLVQIGTKPEPTVTYNSTALSIDTTNANKGAIPYNGIKLTADNSGIVSSWNGFDGNTYTANKVPWDTFESNGYSFRLQDYMPDSAKDVSGNPLFTYTVSLKPNSYAEKEDIINAINGSTISSSASASYNVRFENSEGNPVNFPGVSVSVTSSSYPASYVSAAKGSHTFDDADDPFIEPSPAKNLISSPSATTVEEARNSTESWAFGFDMEGIGHVTASCRNITYQATRADTANDDETYWWSWNSAYIYKDGKQVLEPHFSKGLISRSVGNTLSGAMSALTGAKGSETPGLLTTANGGAADGGGLLTFSFSATSDSAYSSGSIYNGTSVFGFNINVNVNASDTEQDVFNRIQDALNENTRLDISTASDRSEYISVSVPRSGHKIDVPVYDYDGYNKNIEIQSGPEKEHVIDIQYRILNLDMLGLKDTNTLTKENSQAAIEEIRNAMAIVNEERSGFGAYQNRLEHAYNTNKNTEENTQAAESIIRDTDMAAEMVAFSKENVISQVAESMLAQANQLPQQVLNLLQ